MKNMDVKTGDFEKWRSPIRGASNPQRMDNAFWHWCIRNPVSAYEANQNFDGPDSMAVGPCWCFDRIGSASVELTDGRIVHVGGEHEDFYDPDFYIYNDVVVTSGDEAEIEIFGYPTSVFPPTDFHSATLLGSDVLLIGNLGYPDDRVVGQTQIFRLCTKTWQMSKLDSSGNSPGWIHDHNSFSNEAGDKIFVSGGSRFDDEISENINDYVLCLNSMLWTQVTDRKWGRWVFERVDKEAIQLWDIRSSSQMRDLGVSMKDQLATAMSDLPADLQAEFERDFSDQQMDQIATIYQSPFSKDIATEDEEKFSRFRLKIDGVTVRFDEGIDSVTVTVEGTLPSTVVHKMLAILQERLSTIERTEYSLRELK